MDDPTYSSRRRLLLSWMALIAPTYAFDALASPTVKTRVATFSRFVWGDYLYLRVNDSVTGKEIEYYCNVPKCAEWERQEATFANKKILVKWKDSSFHFRQTGQTKVIQEIVDIALTKESAPPARP